MLDLNVPDVDVRGATGFVLWPCVNSADVLRRLAAVSLRATRIPLIDDAGEESGFAVVVPGNVRNLPHQLYTLRAVCPATAWTFVRDGVEAPIEEIEMCRGPGLSGPLSEIPTEAELIAVEREAAEKLFAAHDVLLRILDHAVSCDQEFIDVGRGDDAQLTARRLDLVRGMVVLENTIFELLNLKGEA